MSHSKTRRRCSSRGSTTPNLAAAQREALTSPQRMEIVGLFTTVAPLSISDMAALMRRPAASLYHHVGILENAGILRRAGTRPKGKRHETLYEPAVSPIAIEVEPNDPETIAQITQSMASAFRMAERDLEAAFERDDLQHEGPDRNFLATRLHLRCPPRTLARINKHLQAILDLLEREGSQRPRPAPEDQFLSLTLALLPLRGRRGDVEVQLFETGGER